MYHERVNITPSSISCGVLQLGRLSSDVDDVLYQIACRLYHHSRGDPAAIAVFSDINEKGTNSERLRSKIVELFGGGITVSQAVENPKTGNIIVLYTWMFPHQAFKQWYANERVSRLKSRVGA